ncbi:MAG: hypothetical protein ACYT04_89090, partial [Nostoc sp.]
TYQFFVCKAPPNGSRQVGFLSKGSRQGVLTSVTSEADYHNYETKLQNFRTRTIIIQREFP